MTVPRVFISYSRDSEENKQRVLDLANRLRALGIDAWIDQYSPPPPEGWAVWTERQMRAAHWIVLVCTETFLRRFDLQEVGGKGRGVAYEAQLLRGLIYDGTGQSVRAVPVLFRAEDQKYVPEQLLAHSRYLLPAEYDRLLRHFRGEPEVVAPPLGETQSASSSPVAALPPIHVQSLGAPEAEPSTEHSQSLSPASTKAVPRSVRPRTKRVLIVAACPSDMARLALGKELREICHLLRHSSSVPYQVRVLPAATERDVRDAILAMKPDILHFAGHGAASGMLFEKEDGRAEVMTGAALVHWLKVVTRSQKRRLELAVLNFCHSENMLTELADIADVVVGPTASISDSMAVTFSVGLYVGLSSGCTGAFSYHLGCSALEMNSLSDRAPMGIYGIRCQIEPGDVIATQRESTLTLAFLASEPHNASRLALDRELRGIHRAVDGKLLRIEPRWATRVIDFLQTLVDIRPTVVHLTGHGRDNGTFVFETDHDSVVCHASSLALAKALSLFHSNIRCAVLLFSNSIQVAERLADVLEFVISISGPVSDETCQKFSEVFYQLIASKLSYGEAFLATVSVLRGRNDAGLFSITGFGTIEASSPLSKSPRTI